MHPVHPARMAGHATPPGIPRPPPGSCRRPPGVTRRPGSASRPPRIRADAAHPAEPWPRRGLPPAGVRHAAGRHCADGRRPRAAGARLAARRVRDEPRVEPAWLAVARCAGAVEDVRQPCEPDETAEAGGPGRHRPTAAAGGPRRRRNCARERIGVRMRRRRRPRPRATSDRSVDARVAA